MFGFSQTFHLTFLICHVMTAKTIEAYFLLKCWQNKIVSFPDGHFVFNVVVCIHDILLYNETIKQNSKWVFFEATVISQEDQIIILPLRCSRTKNVNT